MPSGFALGAEPTPREIEALSLPAFVEPSTREEGRSGGKEPEESTASPSVVWEGRATGRELVPDNLPLVMGEALPVVPAKMVKRILKGEFIDMAEFLKDNAEAERRRATVGESGQAVRGSRREIPDFESWLQCLSAYAAVICSRYPDKARELWAYQAFMIAEHRKCGGRGWLIYDSAFRQQITSLERVDFSKVNQSLYSTTFLAYGGRGQFCTHCMLSDHSSDECALHPGRGIPLLQIQDQLSRRARRSEDVSMGDQMRRMGRRGACYAFNDGKCVSPICRFEHICSTCGGNHRRTVCRSRGREPLRGKDPLGAKRSL